MATETVKTGWLRDYDGNKFSPKTSTQSLVGVLDIEHGGTGNEAIYTNYIRVLDSTKHIIDTSQIGYDYLEVYDNDYNWRQTGVREEEKTIAINTGTDYIQNHFNSMAQERYNLLDTSDMQQLKSSIDVDIYLEFGRASNFQYDFNKLVILNIESVNDVDIMPSVSHAYTEQYPVEWDKEGGYPIRWEYIDYFNVEIQGYWNGYTSFRTYYTDTYSYYYLQFTDQIANNSIFYFNLKQDDFYKSRGFIINGLTYQDCFYDKNGNLLPSLEKFDNQDIIIQCLFRDSKFYFLNLDFNTYTKNDININGTKVLEKINTNFNEIVNGYDIKYKCELFDDGSDIYLTLPSIFLSSNRFHNHSELYIDGILIPNSLDNYTISDSNVYLYCLANKNHTAEVILKGMPLTEANAMMRGYYF